MWRRLISWLHGDRDRDIDREIESHLAAEEENLRQAGMPTEEAQRASRLAFGSLTNAREDMRGVWAWAWLEHWTRDFHGAARSLWRRPGFSLLAVAALAAGIGPTSAMFAIVYATLLRPLPYPYAERVVVLYDQLLNDPASRNLASHTQLRAWTEEARLLERVGAYTEAIFTLTGGGQEAERIPALLVSPTLLEILGARIAEGRLYSEADEDVAVGRLLVSASLWKRRFGSAKLNGQTLLVNDEPNEIIGILPNDFLFLDRPYEAIRRLPRPSTSQLGARFLTVLGRLRPGVDVEQARQELAGVAQRLAERFPNTDSQRTVALAPLDELLRGPVRTRILFAMAAVGSLLLITCLNVTSLMVSRNLARHNDIAVRLALGATRHDLFRMLTCEAVFLALGGLVAGIAIAKACLGLLIRFAPGETLKLGVPSVTPSVLAFAGAVMLVASIGIAGVSLRQLFTGGDVGLRRGVRGADANSEGLWARSVLLGSEVALAVLLIISAGASLQTLARLWKTDPGFEPDGALTLELSLPRRYQSDQQRITFLRQVAEEASSIPGMQQAGLTHRLPLGADQSKRAVNIGVSPDSSRQEMIEVRRVSPHFFNAMGMRLLRGRFISDQDTPETVRVAVVNERFVRRFLGDTNPIAQHVFVQDGPTSTPLEIVGVVNDVRQAGLATDPQPELYVSVFVHPSRHVTLVLRGHRDTASLVPEARRILARMDPNMPLAAAVPLSEFVAGSIMPQRSLAFVLSSFSLLAMVLAMVGVYGVCTFSVMRRTAEIGIRIALGANRANIVSLFLGWLLRVVISGAGIGAFLALLLNRWAAQHVAGLDAPSIGVLGICVIGFLFVAAVAGLPPAIRASTVDPAVAQRSGD